MSEDGRTIVEHVPPSIMSRQERLDELERIIKHIKANAVRPSKYRLEHYKAIYDALAIAQTPFWKESTFNE